MRHTLRGQPPPRSSTLRTSHPIRPPLTHPIVESWLESIHPSPTGLSNKTTQTTTTSRQNTVYAVATRPVGKHFDQLPVGLQDGPSIRSGRVWLVICTGLRAMSFSLATAALVVIGSFVEDQIYWQGIDRFTPAMVFCPLVMLWNLADLGTAAFRRGRGFSARVHVFPDGVLVIGLANSAGFAMADILDWIDSDDWLGSDRYNHDVPKKIAAACLLVLIMIIHSYLFSFYFFQKARATRRQRELHTPRIMFLPSGAAVMVTPQPVRGSSATSRPVPIELRRMGTTSAVSRPTPSDRNHSMESRRMERLNIVIPQTPTLVATRSPLSAVLGPAVPTHAPLVAAQATAQVRQPVPARKPVATGTGAATTSTDPGPSVTPQPATKQKQVGTHYASPWPGPDYQPDEAELERAARGEAQAQWMSLHGMDLKKEKSSEAKSPV